MTKAIITAFRNKNEVEIMNYFDRLYTFDTEKAENAINELRKVSGVAYFNICGYNPDIRVVANRTFLKLMNVDGNLDKSVKDNEEKYDKLITRISKENINRY